MKRSQKLMKNIMFNPLKDLSEAYDKVENFIGIDEAIRILKPQSRWVDRPHDQDQDTRSETHVWKETNNGPTGSNKSPFRQQYDNKAYTPLNANRIRILNEIKDKPFLSHVQWVIIS